MTKCSVLRHGVLAGLALLLMVAAAAAQDGEYEEFDGLLEPFELVHVSSQVPGILDEIPVERGDIIRKHQVLARLKSDVEKAAVELSRARVEFGKRKAERNEELFRKKLISVHEKDEIETEVRLSELELKEAVERLEMRTIYSTIDGVVVERLRAPGDYIGEESIMTVACIDPLNVEVIVPVSRIGTISKGMTAEIRPESPVGGVYSAEVVIVDRVVDAASGTFGVRLELQNPAFALSAGLKCKVRFHYEAKRK